MESASHRIAGSRIPLLGIALALFFSGDALSSLSFRTLPLLLTVLAVTMALALAITFAIRLVVHDECKMLLTSVVVIFWFFFYSTIQKMLGQVWQPISHQRYALPLTLIAAAILVGLVVRSKRNLTVIRDYSQLIGAILSLYTLGWWFTLVNSQSEFVGGGATGTGIRVSKEFIRPRSESSLPDIYYIILDAYANHESLAHFWSYDNSPFENSLRQRGFRIVPHATSPFTRTGPCVASYLDMQTFDGKEPSRSVIANASAVTILEHWGYKVSNLSFFDLPGKSRFYDYSEFQEGKLSDAWLVFRRISIFWMLLGLTDADMSPTNEAIRAELLSVVRRGESPKFVYAHFMMPHSPYTIDSNDVHLKGGTYTGMYNQGAYLSQLKGTNRFILPVVDSIIARSGRDCVIILQGDHGSRIVDKGRNSVEAHSPFDAIRIPHMPDSLFSDSLSPTETLRIVLRRLSTN